MPITGILNGPVVLGSSGAPLYESQQQKDFGRLTNLTVFLLGRTSLKVAFHQYWEIVEASEQSRTEPYRFGVLKEHMRLTVVTCCVKIKKNHPQC
ncbi:undecaprenyl-phosphate galactose phosphotransferase WbaP [Sesbania bispinosa]|nr:undecaprenyl-phosphate galactose phosphotransferase WbaP [Sesbania bispinosa]